MSCDLATEHTGSVSRPIVRRRRGLSTAIMDRVVEEFPVALVFNGTPSNEQHERRIYAALDAIYRDLGLAPG